MPRGRFISFEGIDGAGKSTQHSWAADYLVGKGVDVVKTREPGGTPLGEKLRALLLGEAMHLETEALLMFAARREHVEAVIEPALSRDAWVLCDRFVDASFAYQGGGRGLPWERIRSLADWTLGSLRPDLTLVFDVPVELARERLARGSTTPDRFEREEAEFFERVRQAYHRLARENPARIRLIDAAQPVNIINKQLEEILSTIGKS